MKYILAHFENESMDIDMTAFDTYEDAYAAMEESYNELVEGEDVFDSYIGENSAMVSSEYADVWRIQAFE